MKPYCCTPSHSPHCPHLCPLWQSMYMVGQHCAICIASLTESSAITGCYLSYRPNDYLSLHHHVSQFNPIGCSLHHLFAGGPHAVVVADFMVWPVCLAALGFAVLMGTWTTRLSNSAHETVVTMPTYIPQLPPPSLPPPVNYQGSTGFGQDAVLHLLGKVGRSDVDDVHVSASLLTGCIVWCVRFSCLVSCSKRWSGW